MDVNLKDNNLKKIKINDQESKDTYDTKTFKELILKQMKTLGEPSENLLRPTKYFGFNKADLEKIFEENEAV